MAYEPGKYSPPEVPESNGSPENPIPQSALFSSKIQPKIVLGDGTEIAGASAVPMDSDTKLWIRIPTSSGIDLGQAFQIFSNTVKTQKIEKWFMTTDLPEVYENYTQLNLVKMDDGGWIAVRMIREF